MLKTAIFINDYLLLLDFLSKIEEEFPLLEYTIFGDKEFAESLEDSAEGYVETDLSLLKDAELLIMLAKPMHDEKLLKILTALLLILLVMNFLQMQKYLKYMSLLEKF